MLPTFFVIGAGKSGTTALHSYLDLHPEIEMTARKEVHYLLGPDWRARVAGYDGEFAGGPPQRGDASPGYTVFPRHPDTPRRMRELVPGARLVYLVRDPVERAIAQYAQHVITDVESRSPAQALDPDEPDNDYLCISAYATQVEHYLTVFERERLLVLDHRELLERRREALGRVFAFLGVDAAYWTPEFERTHNVRGRDNVRLPATVRRLQSSALRRVVPPLVRGSLRSIATRRLGRRVEPDVEPGLRRRMEERLAPEAARLRELTGLELAHWSV